MTPASSTSTSRPPRPSRRGREAEAWRRKVLWVARTLGSTYGVPRLGNPRAPLDDLIYVLLSQRTTLERARTAYLHIRRQYYPWQRLLEAKETELQEGLRPIGLWRKRARDLLGIARALTRRFGRVTLTPIRRWPASDTFTLLVSLPGVGEKTARCVMLYTLGHETSPVDVHAYRALTRLGLLGNRTSVDEAHRLLDAKLPAGVAYRLHVALVAHGRTTCVARPRCGTCVLRTRCASAPQA